MERSVQAENISKHAVLASNILFLESYQTENCTYLYAHMQVLKQNTLNAQCELCQ